MSRRFRIIAYVIAGLTVLVTVYFGVVSTPWVQRYLERRMISGLEEATGARVEIRESQFRPLILQFILHDLVVRGKEPSASPPLFAAKTVVIELSPRAIFEWKPLLRSLDWDKAEIHLYTYPDGTTNLPDPPLLAEAGGAVGRLALSRTNVFWNEHRLRADLGASDVAILIRRHPAGKYSGSLSTSSIRFQTATAGLPTLALNAHFEISSAGLCTQTLTWQAAGLTGRGTIDIRNWHSPEFSFSYDTSGDLRELAAFLKTRELRGGNVISRGTVTYLEHRFGAKGTLQVMHLAIQTPRGQFSEVSFATDFSADSSKIFFPNITGTALSGSFQSAGEISLEDTVPRFAFRTRFAGLSLPQILNSVGAPTRQIHVSSQASGTLEASWQGAFRDFRSQFAFEFRPEARDRPGAVPVSGLLRGAARLAPDAVFEIAQADLRTRASQVSAHGTVGLHNAELALQFSVADFEEWRASVEAWVASEEPIPLRLDSRLTFQGLLSGPVQNLRWQGQVASGPFVLRGTQWDSLRGDIGVSPEVVRVASAQLKFKESELRVEGAIPLKAWRLDADGPLHLTVNAEKTPLEGLTKAIGTDFPVSGALSGKLEVGGTVASSSGAGRVQVENGSISGEPFDSLAAVMRVDRSVWHFNEVLWRKGQGRAQGEGEFAFATRDFRLRMTGSDFRLGEIQRLRRALGAGPGPDVQGRLSFDVQAHGRPGNVVMGAAARAQGVVIASVSMGDIAARLDWKGQHLSVEGSSEGAGGAVRFSGSGRTSDEWPLALQGEFRSLRLDPWIHLFSARDSGPELAANGTLQAQLPLKNFGAAELAMEMRDLLIKYPELSWKSADPVKVRYSKKRLSVERFRLQGPATDLQVEGSMQFEQGGSLAFLAEGNAEATLLSLLDPALQANGGSTVKVRIAGSLDRPTVHGTLRVQDVSVGYGDLPFRVTGLRGDIVLEGERATLRSLRGASGGGTVSLGGFVAFGAAPRFNVQADLSQVRLRYPSDFTSLLDGTLRLAGSAERGQISGELVVHQIFPPENFNWLARVGEAGTAAALAPSAIHSPIAPRIRLNVRISSASAVRFESRDLRLVADIDMRIQGTLAEPVEVGTIQILSGEAVFRGNRYAIKHGDISMTNPFRTQRVLGIEARTRVQRYDLTVNIAGPFDRLRITYRSDPPLPTADIVTLLAFGYARQQEEMATGTTHPIAAVGASALLSQALSSQVSGRIQRLFGVSRIKIDPNVGGVGTPGGTRITVEQRVAPELTITYVTSTGTSQYRIIQLEWAVTDRVSLIGERDQGGIFGMEVHFRQRFR
jgi:translocation and assembly module TamB